MASDIKQLESKLWEAADHLRANSSLRLNEFAEPVLGLIFLKFADVKFTLAQKEIEAEVKASASKRLRPITPEDYQSRGVLFVPEHARFSYLIALPEGADMGKTINDAMKEIEASNKDLAGVLPKSYNLLENSAIITLLKNLNHIPDNIEGDAFGLIYEYFLGEFALADGSGGGEFFTPTSIVKLIVEILEPYHGKIYDPACGSGGMFVQSLEFIKKHLENGKRAKASREISIYGQEKTDQTVRIAKMNLAIHGLSGDIRQGNTYYEDLHRSVGKFDFALANPPFNVSDIDLERIKDDPRFIQGLPKANNGNYLWIQIFLNALNSKGRAGFVMHNSALDSDLEIRKKIVEENVVDVVINTASNLFYNVSLPCSLWFFDKNRNASNRNKVLFIDASQFYVPVDTAHREMSDTQISEIAAIVASFRENQDGFKNIPGVCSVVSMDILKENNFSLNPKLYIEYEKKKAKENNLSSEDVNQLVSNIRSRKLEIESLLGHEVLLDRGILFAITKRLFDKHKSDIESRGHKKVPLRSIVDSYIGGTWGEQDENTDFKNRVRVFRGTDLFSATYGDMANVPLRYVKDSQIKSRQLFAGDIVIEVSGGGKEISTGRTLLITDDLINGVTETLTCASFCKLFRLKSTISPSYIYLFLQDLHQHGLMAKYEVQSTGIKNFKFENFLDKQNIPLGSDDEQSIFESKVGKIFGLMHLIGQLESNINNLSGAPTDTGILFK
jgi:type I restriction enzyme M protein